MTHYGGIMWDCLLYYYTYTLVFDDQRAPQLPTCFQGSETWQMNLHTPRPLVLNIQQGWVPVGYQAS